MPSSRLIRLFLATVTALSLSGCATYVTVSSQPEGADIFSRGSGRPNYRWEPQGKAPVTFKVYYSAINTVARWPDDTVSEPKHTSLRGQSNVHVHHEKADTAESN